MNSSKFTLADCITMGIKKSLLDVNTCLPGQIESYDTAKMTAQVRVGIDRLINGEQTPFPVLDEVPVIFPRAGKYAFTFPLAKGDGVLLVFNQRSVDRYKASGPGQPPIDNRMFALSDAVAIPGFTTTEKALNPPPIEGVELRGDKLFIGDPEGSGAPTAGLSKSDLVQALAKVIEQLLSVPLVSSMGPVNFDPAVISALQEIQTMIEGFEP